MPYRIRGKTVEHFKDGKWSVKQVCKSHGNAIKALRLLEAIERGRIKREK